MKALAVLLLVPGGAFAQEFVPVAGSLDDEAFYRAVACAAAPGGRCRKPFLRWSDDRRRDLSVALASVTDTLEPWQRDLYERGLSNAVAQINALDAGIRLSRGDGAGDIEVHIVATPPGHVMRDTGVPDLDGALLSLGRVALRARDGEIREALIAVSAQARRREIASILLEEIVQSLGLMTDVRGPAYRRSLFSEDGNSVVRLEGQDAMALRRHYAPDPVDRTEPSAPTTDISTGPEPEES
ncbi:DUF2927 domain-containing protein [Jannaschia donghaensis]|uniref:N-acetyltransferase domain-containing protein n=1 Tax=Jannaschia donghaensis TaxID=420998 RepID=A0A0M6YGR0_9RHOB|nr:DUF2927 domain-containing protein [Jannaschia donghaensis]CTQ48266.1 hypothetical protein JDO7802_00268 [Jannaschia donghaensis]